MRGRGGEGYEAGQGRPGGRGGGRRRPTPLNDFLPQCPEELQTLLRVPPPLAIPLVHLQRLQPLGELDLELQRVAAEAPAVAACAVRPATAAAAAAAAATGC